jgi:hypothetical protein
MLPLGNLLIDSVTTFIVTAWLYLLLPLVLLLLVLLLLLVRCSLAIRTAFCRKRCCQLLPRGGTRASAGAL